jgi:hypothetical protein
VKKTVYTLAVKDDLGNDYEPEITAITFPLMKKWAKKIGADFYVIEDRKFKDMPPVYEKFQIYELGKEHGNDWNIFLDADTLIHPDFWDVTEMLNKDTTCSGYSSDFSPIRFKPDKYFNRDGRYIGKGNWCQIGSDWCLDLWKPLDDITPEEAYDNIYPTYQESSTVIERKHLIDDYLVSRNIARYGLKHTLISEIEANRKVGCSGHLWHQYLVPGEKKLIWMKNQLHVPSQYQLDPATQAWGSGVGWGLSIEDLKSWGVEL